MSRALVFAFLFAPAALFGQGTRQNGSDALPLVRRLELNDTFRRQAQEILNTSLRAELPGEPRGHVTLNLEFDLARATSDWNARLAAASRTNSLPTREEIDAFKGLLRDTPPPVPPPGSPVNSGTATGSNAAPMPRLGPLNLDLQGVTFPPPAKAPLANSLGDSGTFGPLLSFQIPLPPAPQLVSVAPLDPARYVKSFRMELGVPSKFSESGRERLRTLVVSSLELVDLVGSRAATSVSVVNSIGHDPVAPEKSGLESVLSELATKVGALLLEKETQTPEEKLKRESKGWADKALDPSSGVVGSMAGAALVSFALLMGILAARSALGGVAGALKQSGDTLAGALASLAPEKETAGSEDHGAQAGAIRDQAATENESPFGRESVATSLANARDEIKEELRALLESTPLPMAEAFAKLLQRSDNRNSLFHLAQAIGFDALGLLAEKLPTKAQESMREIFDSPPPHVVDDIQGLALARHLLVSARSRIFSLGDQTHPSQERCRAALLGADDAQLAAWAAAEKQPARLAAALRLLSSERSSVVVSAAVSSVLVDATRALDNASAEAYDFAGVVEELEAHSQGKEKLSRRLKLIKQVAKEVSLEDESKIAALVPQSDFSLRRELLAERLFLADLVHVPQALLKAALERRPSKERAAVLWLLPSEARTRVLKAFGEGSRALEALTAELEDIDTSAPRREAANGRRRALLAPLLADLQTKIVASPLTVNEFIRSLAESLGETPPSWALNASEQAADSSSATMSGAA